MEIKELIVQKGVFEVKYEKPDGTIMCHILSDVKLSGENYIKACSCKSGNYLTFKIERIKKARQIWSPIWDKDTVAPESGLYVFVYESDNHYDFEVYQLFKGKKLLKYFVGEHYHPGQMDLPPYAFHYVEVYNPNIEQEEWKKWEMESDGGRNLRNNFSMVIAAKLPSGEVQFGIPILGWGMKEGANIIAYHPFFNPTNSFEPWNTWGLNPRGYEFFDGCIVEVSEQ